MRIGVVVLPELPSVHGLAHFGEFLAQAIMQRIRARAANGESDERAIETWERVHEIYARSLGLHLIAKRFDARLARRVQRADRRRVDQRVVRHADGHR